MSTLRTISLTWCHTAATTAAAACAKLCSDQHEDAAAGHTQRLPLLQGGILGQLIVGGNGGWRQVDVRGSAGDARARADGESVTAWRRICSTAASSN